MTAGSRRPRSLFSRTAVIFASVGLMTLATSISVQAEVDRASLSWDNDLFAGKDGGGYTNGIYISWYDNSNEGSSDLKPPLLTLPLAWMQSDNPTYTYSVHTLGQSMVTPEDITKSTPDAFDAPYAGLLFLRSAYTSVQNDFADHVSTLVGIIGPSSRAEETQKFIHKVVGSEQPKGWEYQLHDEFIWQLERVALWRFSTSDASLVDAVILADIAVGNLESLAGAGLFFRAGSGLARSYSSMGLLANRVSNPMAAEGGWFFYIGGTSNYVHNQILVDGQEFDARASPQLKHGQYSLMTGFTYSWRRLGIGFSYQNDSAPDKSVTARQEFGAITLSWKM